MRRVWVCAFLLSFWMGPAIASDDVAGGELIGKWRPEGRGVISLTMKVNRERSGEGRISTRLGPDGERFVGEYLRLTGKNADVKVRRYYVGWTASAYDDLGVGPSGLVLTRETYSFELFRKRHQHAVVATLIGDRGSRMRCRFELHNEKSGLPGGADGNCQMNNGEIIEFGSDS